MTREEAIRLLEAAKKSEEAEGDWEKSHEAADSILCELLISLGYEDVVAAWNDVSKWYS